MLVTYTGKKFDYNNITKDSICIEDIIHSLPRINRFIGHSTRAYTDAEHLLLCLVMAEKLGYSPRLKLLTFIHDFPEAYTGDFPTPLKKLMPELKELEKKIEKALYEHLEIEPPTEVEHQLVKRIDNTMLVIEMRDLTLHDYEIYINDSTYLELLDDDDFKIGLVGYDEKQLQNMLSEIFNSLIGEVRGD
jgi:5'-deoxynucleotidase YfbR-like HD superfamily hydrolase